MHSSMPIRVSARQWMAITAAFGGLAGLTACGGGGGSSPQPTSASSAHAVAAALPTGVSNASVPAKVPNDATLRKQVTLSSCTRATGGWQAGGTAANGSTTPADYTVTVFFITSGDTVIGTGKTHVQVPPRATRPWKVAAQFAAAPTTLCVLRGVG